MQLNAYRFWFVTGSQFLYGEETLRQVEADGRMIAAGLSESGNLPCPVLLRGVMKTAEEITQLVKAANYDDSCAGIITFMHTFSPSKMWINGLKCLQKPYLHFHTQFHEEIPNEAIDMDYMNLHQSAHGDREHGFIGARVGLPRKIVVGHWQDAGAQRQIGTWMRAAVGAAVSKELKVMRFGDNMREVAVTEGDKVAVQMKLGWQVNTWPVGALAEEIQAVTDGEIDALVAEYRARYDVAADDMEAVRYQAREEIAMGSMLAAEGCTAFTNTFQDLFGMRQLPGLASQNLMRRGYGYGGEGDWKTAALTRIMKQMTQDLCGGTGFMEDYTYDFKRGLTLGAHMLEVCPSLAAQRPKVVVHPLGIGEREPPARLVFEGKAGAAVVASLVDMGGRLRLIVQDIACVKPTQTMPNLPVARVMWKPMPDLATGAKAWILAGGAHHTVLSYDCDAALLRDFARIMDIEFVHIHQQMDMVKFEQELMLSDMIWRMRSQG